MIARSCEYQYECYAARVTCESFTTLTFGDDVAPMCPVCIECLARIRGRSSNRLIIPSSIACATALYRPYFWNSQSLLSRGQT